MLGAPWGSLKCASQFESALRGVKTDRRSFFSLLPLTAPPVGVMLQRVSLALLLPALARSEDYVAFQALSNTNLPPARALSATVLQHTVSANAALGRCVPSVA